MSALGRCSVYQRDIMSTLGMFSTSEGYHDGCGGYHEHTGGVQYIGGIP